MSTGRGELIAELNMSLREVRDQLMHVTSAVGGQVGLGPTEIGLIDLIARTAPVTPGHLATMTGLNPATITGVLDRLEEGGWIRRERDAVDRRRVFIHPNAERAQQLGPKFGVMLKRMSDIYAGYSDKELRTLLDFMQKVRDAGGSSVNELREEHAT
jgi:DNA-binding MarR family transcriptional regulator